MNVERLYLDLDGTLIDSSPGILHCVRHALEILDAAAPDDRRLRNWIGPPLRASFADLLGEGSADRAVELYRDRYNNTGWREFSVYPGIFGMLDGLVEHNIQLALATSKPRVFAERILEHAGLSRYLSAVFGAELDGTRSDKTDLLAHAETALGHQPAGMLGDRRYDVAGARANGLLAVGAGWGFANDGELHAAGADVIFSSPQALLSGILTGMSE